jgi:hypothetical protein
MSTFLNNHLGAATATSLTVAGQAVSAQPAILAPTGMAQTIDWAAGNCQILSLAAATGTVTVSFLNPKAGGSYIIEVEQHLTVPQNITWPINVKWPSATAPTISTGAGAVDMISLYYNGSFYRGNYGQDYR